MKKFFLLLLIFLFLLSPPIAFAHPGRTAADGCHYCRTRCDYWGERWNARHCHGIPPPPSPPPSPKPSPIQKPKSSPTPTPAVLGIDSQETQDSESFWNLATLAFIGGLVGLVYMLRKKASGKEMYEE